MNRRSTLFIFVFLLIAAVLVSAITVVVLWAKPDNPNKPDNTGKPDESLPDYVEADFKIWIGTGNLDPPEDVVLQPFGDPLIDYLFVDDWNGGLWLPLPPKKGNKPVEGGWVIYLGNVNISPGREEPEYCGTYAINDEDLLNELNEVGIYPEDTDAEIIIIAHEEGEYRPPDETPFETDFWHIRISWMGILYTLEGKTDMGIEPEGEFDEATDTWTITFDTSFEFLESTGEIDPETGSIGEIKLWEGPLSFTVEIQRILP